MLHRAIPGRQLLAARGDATAAGCEEVVTVETTRTLAAKHAELELEFMSGFFGGFLGITTDLYLSLGAMRLWCVVSLIINFALMFILRHFVRALFYGTVFATHRADTRRLHRIRKGGYA